MCFMGENWYCCRHWFGWGSLRCKCQNKAEDWTILSSSASLLLLGTISKGPYSSHPFFLKPCLFCVLSLPKNLLSPKSFLRGYSKYSGTCSVWMYCGKWTLILAVFKENPQLIFRAWVKACWTLWKDILTSVILTAFKWLWNLYHQEQVEYFLVYLWC